ncbi:unnamed protein product, partial [Brassica oleracea var. botrytis]
LRCKNSSQTIHHHRRTYFSKEINCLVLHGRRWSESRSLFGQRTIYVPKFFYCS